MSRKRSVPAEQAFWCERLGSPFTALLCGLIGERLDRTTAVGRRALDWPGEPSAAVDALALRLCGGLHALVRAGAVPELAKLYPPAPLPEGDVLWAALAPAPGEDELATWLERAPQTNEVGRSAVLMAGLLALAERFPQPMHLLELGASAGLNLRLDAYGYDLGGRRAGRRLTLHSQVGRTRRPRPRSASRRGAASTFTADRSRPRPVDRLRLAGSARRLARSRGRWPSPWTFQ